MFAINYMSSKKRIVSRIEDETGKLGTQSRIYDCNTGLYTRILVNNKNKYLFKIAKEVGVENFGKFNNFHYKGLYNGKTTINKGVLTFLFLFC